MSAIDWRRPRPLIAKVMCPGCDAPYPTGLVAAIGEINCGGCGTAFVLRNGQGVRRLQTQPEALVVASAVVEPPRKPKRYRRPDASGKASTSVRTSENELAEWRASAEAAGLTLNGWLRRNAAEAIALERSAANHPDGPPREAT